MPDLQEAAATPTTRTRRTSPSAPGSSATASPGSTTAPTPRAVRQPAPLRPSRLPRRQHGPADLRPGRCTTRSAALSAPSAPALAAAPSQRPSRRHPQQQKQQKELDKILAAGSRPEQAHHDTVKKLQDLLRTSRSSRSCRRCPSRRAPSRIQQLAHRQPPQLPPRAMNGRGRVGSLAASPTMVGAITTLIILVAVFLAYNANNGLPFVPTYKVSAEICDAARLGPNNEVRIGGNRVGVVESIDTVAGAAEQRLPGGGRLERLDRRQAQPEAGQERGAASRGLDDPGPLPLLVRPQVPRDQPRHERRPGCPPAATMPLSQSTAAGRVRRRLQHLRHRDPREQPPGPAGIRRRLRRPRRLAERGDRRPQPAVREPAARLARRWRIRPPSWSASSPSSPTRPGSSPRSRSTTPSSSPTAPSPSARSPPTRRRSGTRSRVGRPHSRPGSARCRSSSRSSPTSPTSRACSSPAFATCAPPCRS